MRSSEPRARASTPASCRSPWCVATPMVACRRSASPAKTTRPRCCRAHCWETLMTIEPLHVLRRAGAALALCAAGLMGAHAATIQVINIDDPGVGFNEATPAAPVGGHAGTTLGEQRQIVFAFVADCWGRKLRSDIPIQVLATFAPLDCDSTSGVLGAAGAYNVFSDFPNGKPGTWYPGALANKLAGVKLEPNPDPFVSADIISFFNGELGKPGCLDGLSFYLGLDGKPAANQIDLLTTVLHEFGHGLGF